MCQQHRKQQVPPYEQGQADHTEPSLQDLWKRAGVLVVDDEHMVRAMLQLALERYGFDVWVASNGGQAVDLYREHREDIAVVLLDVCMPGLDGPQTLDALRELNPGVLACFMTGDTGAYTTEELRQRGGAKVIAKPFHLDDLANVLRLLAQGVFADLSPARGTGQR